MIGYRNSGGSQISRQGSQVSSTTGPPTAIDDKAVGPRRVKLRPGSTVTATTSGSAEGSGYRTLNDVQEQVAQEIAVRCINKSEIVDGVRIGVYVSVDSRNEEDFLRRIAANITEQLRLSTSYLFVLASSVTSAEVIPGSLLVVGATDDLVQRGMLLVSSKFVGRIVSSFREDLQAWSAVIQELGNSSYDDKALWDVVRKAARKPIDPLLPPPGSRGIDQILADARSKLQRITAIEAWRELKENQVSAPTFLVDIRPTEQRQKHGGIHGSLVIERNVLEWRLDPRCDARLAIADRYDLRVIVFCQEGYTSSLAAYSLHKLGLLNATDIIGGFEAWKMAGLPIDTEGSRPEPRSLASLAGSVV
ncbi:rhodanese domain-containing protein [Coprinopsis cinerea okayama7|uniref:Rhodanese domain-containing protein n=1 Tax=Coprinopsis cinerea (strain Okayama-7 / 130 / ATCC MYA-4618 / FGSC 9003) TaxID=240176 RepID=A8NKF5_COPC7|nr:rhodanese domain-containing protein [Coprinopsis cinerea okayama7\|eukprot:XP_001834434.1 rhodanese domain-containing protein [Coprinopsis cinerea okayama7\